jgi:hypothetical protein
MQAVKKNLVNIIILVLLVIVALQRCEPTGPSEQPTIVRDTVLVVKESLTVSKPQLTKTIEIESHDSIILKEYVPDTNYAKLVAQYQEVVNQLLAKNIMQDSVAIDSVGYVKITDTVQKNLIVGRSVQSKISYPIITETITLPAKKTNQLYVGGAILGSPAPNAIMGSALLKTRNDFLFGGSLSVNTYGDTQYGIHSYWKIKLKK